MLPSMYGFSCFAATTICLTSELVQRGTFWPVVFSSACQHGGRADICLAAYSCNLGIYAIVLQSLGSGLRAATRRGLSIRVVSASCTRIATRTYTRVKESVQVSLDAQWGHVVVGLGRSAKWVMQERLSSFPRGTRSHECISRYGVKRSVSRGSAR